MSTLLTEPTLMPSQQTEALPPVEADTRRVLADACRAKKALCRRYLTAADALEADGLHVIAHAFRFTAAQEREHEAVLTGLLHALGGACLPCPAETPLPADPMALLKEAARIEQDMGTCVYPQAACAAEAEGHPRVAETLRRMATLELCHARRFLQYARALAEDTLFHDAQRVSWLCLACGQFHMGQEAPERCPSCGCDRGHFIRSSYQPFSLN